MGIPEDLQKLDDLHSKGALNDIEYSRAKALLLQGRSEPSSIPKNDIETHQSLTCKIIALSSALVTTTFTLMRGSEKDIWTAWLFFVLPSVVYASWPFWLPMSKKWTYIESVGSACLMISFVTINILASRIRIFEPDASPSTTNLLLVACAITFLLSVVAFIALLVKSLASLATRGFHGGRR